MSKEKCKSKIEDSQYMWQNDKAEWRTHFLLDNSVWDILQEPVYEERREPFVNLKDLQNVMSDWWHIVDDKTVRKAALPWKGV